MNADLKAKWIAALRSGAYIQAQGYLKHRNSYCCLGVLCAVSGVEPDYVPDEPMMGYRAGAGYDLVYKLIGKYDYNELWPMNDNGMSFVELADYIEKHISADEEPA